VDFHIIVKSKLCLVKSSDTVDIKLWVFNTQPKVRTRIGTWNGNLLYVVSELKLVIDRNESYRYRSGKPVGKRWAHGVGRN
jgi:hypothetical protein